MVIAGVVIESRDEKKLRKIGVKDSKELLPKQREEIARKIEEIARNIIILRVPACKIDSYRARNINLDRIEAMKMAEVISMSNANKVYIDSLTSNPEKFKKMILEYLPENNFELVVENYADERYPIVGAASIIAKVSRDDAIKEIERKEGVEIGVGYSHDQRTIEFVKKIIKEREELPPYVRKSWITFQMLQEKSWQKKLKDFFKKIKI